MARTRDVIDHAAVFHRKGCALCLCVVSAHGTLCHGRQIPYRQQRSGECRAAAGIGAQELPFLPQPRGGIPCGHRLFAVGNMPLVGHKSGKMAYRCILPHSGLLRKTSGGTPASHVDTAGAESPFLRFNIPKGSEKIGGGMAGNDISRFEPAIARRTDLLRLPPPSCNESRHSSPIREFS